jgi:ribonuclease Y
MSEFIIVAACVIACGIGFAVAFWVRGRIFAQKIKADEGEALRILEDAKRRSETLIKEAELEAKDKIYRIQSEFESGKRDPLRAEAAGAPADTEGRAV